MTPNLKDLLASHRLWLLTKADADSDLALEQPVVHRAKLLRDAADARQQAALIEAEISTPSKP